jgi:glycosyltransferase involved in cell wall biosynthesis
VVVPNGIDLSPFLNADRDRVQACRRELLRGRRGPLIVSVGALAARKGHHVLVEATPKLLERFPDALIAIVGGSGNNAAAIGELIRSLGLESQVACLGERMDIPEVLSSSDLFVLPSLIEGMPLALLEAMAAGTPVVATRVGGVPSLIADGVTGRLVPPAHSGALGRAMIDTLNAPALSRKLAAAARAQVETQNRAEVWVERLRTLYAEVAEDGRDGRSTVRV